MYRPTSIHTRLLQALHVLGILMPLYPPLFFFSNKWQELYPPLFWLGVGDDLPPQTPHVLLLQEYMPEQRSITIRTTTSKTICLDVSDGHKTSH